MGASSVQFHNSYTTVIYVAYLRLDNACGDECGDPWDVLGWVRLSPGDSQSRANPTSNKYYYYYAEAGDGAYWAGPYVAEVTNDRFEKCTCLGVIVQNGGATNPSGSRQSRCNGG
jgi:uncharacterized membrane protein